MVTYYAALAIETDIMITFGLEDLGMGLFLCGANLLVFGFVLGLGWQRFRRERLAAEKKKSKAEKRESAFGFTRQKFKTTFDAINHSSVPASHAMLFYCAFVASSTCADHDRTRRILCCYIASNFTSHVALRFLAVP